MERSVLVEENHQRSDSTLVSKSARSPIKIDSISIDLPIAKEKTEPGNCEHFSIRGYISDIRKKDEKICRPFGLDGNNNKSEEQTYKLPPLHVAKFRWWRCQNCLREIGTKGTEKEIGMVSNCCKTGFKSNSTCSHMSCHGDAAVLLSDLQQASKLNFLEGRKADANTSSNVNSDEYCLSLCSDKKGKKAEVAFTTSIGHENGLQDYVNQEIPRPTCGAKKINPCLMRERHTDVTVALKSKCNGLVDFSKPNCGSHEVADIWLAIRNFKSTVNSTVEICQTGKQTSADDQQREVMTSWGTSKEVGVVDEAFNAVKDHSSGLPSLELDECGYALSESDEILVGNNLHDQHHRKTRKVRFLAELLGANGNAKPDRIRTEDAPSNAMPDASSGAGSLSALQGEVAVQGNVGRGFRDQRRKRKMPQDEDWGPLEMSGPNNVTKKVRVSKGDAETTDINIAIAGSESEEDASAGIGLQTCVKSHWTKHRIGRNPILGKKKNKKDQIDDGCSSLVSSREVSPKENQDKIRDADKCTATDTVLFKSEHDMFTGRGMEPFLKSNFSAQRTERKSRLYKKKNKMPQAEDGQASLSPQNNGKLREGPTTRKDVDIMQTGAEIVPFQSVQDASAGQGLHLSHNSYLAAQRNERIYIPQVADALDCLLPQEEGIPREDQIMMKDAQIKYLRDSRVPFKSAPDAFFGKGAYCDLSSKRTTHRMSFLNGKQNYTPQVEHGGCSLMRQTDFSGTCNDEKTIEVPQHSEVIKKHGDRRADKVFEQGALDDIPMEIVELMAKNQYERCLHDAQNNYCLLETTNNTRNAEVIDFTKLYGHGVLRLLQEENPHIQKPQSRKARNGILPTGEKVGPPKQKSVGYSSHISGGLFNMGQLEEAHASTGMSAFSRCQEQLSNGVQFSATGSSRQSSARNCKWNGATVGPRSPHTSFQALEAYNTGQTVSRQNEASHVWSSVIPNHKPFGLNIPQKCATQSNNINLLSQGPSTLCKEKISRDHDLKYLNPNVTNFEKQNRNFGSETSNRTLAENPFACKHKGIELHPKLMGSLDLYSNETIPAMHLLSLMDAGMRSSTPFNTDENPELLKKPSFPHHLYSEFSRLETGAYKTSDTLEHPSSDYYGKNHLSEKSCECSPAVPTVGAFVSSFQNDGNFRRATDFRGQVSLKSREKEKTKGSSSLTKKRGRRSQKSVSPSAGFGTNLESILVHDTQKRSLVASDSMLFPLQCQRIGDSEKRIELEVHSNYGAVWPMKRSSETEICSVNRNPADFSMPEAGNVYTIGGEDLKFGKRIPSGNRSGFVNVDGHKRQRIMKLTAVKKRSRHRTS